MRTTYFSALLWVMCLAGVAFAQESKPKYQVMGIGGAGGMFVPSISPNDPKLMFIACDMSGTYRSTDGGQTWAMYHWTQLSSSLRCRPAFGKDAIYWASGGQVKVSKDGGATWQALVAGEQPWQKEEPVRIAVADGDKTLVVGTSGGLYVSDDAGKTWKKAADGAVRDLAVVDADVYALSANGLSVSRDGGKSWEAINVTMPGGQPGFSVSGASDGKETVLYVANKAGIAQSKDGGKTWQVVDNKSKCNVVQVPQKQTQVAWAAQEAPGRDVYVTKDGGKTWTSCFLMDGQGANVERSWVQTQLHWGYNISPLGLGIDPANPQVAMISTQGDFYITRDGGKSWQQLMNKPIGKEGNDPGFRYQCNGLEVTSCWQTLFDPSDDQKMYIAYTDIGFSRSVDRGQTWISANEGCPWGNTYYQVVFDPTVKGKLYAACSSRHDIPHWTHIDANKGQQGGVCVSDNYGQSWKVLGTGLPKLPCTSIALDPKTSGAGLTMYVTLYEGGVYKSIDGGQTWQNKSNGLGNKGNNHAFMVKVHPKTGNLFCSITAFRNGTTFAVPGGIWKSTDGGENWTDISKSLDLRWPTGFAFDPNDENIIYLAASTAPQFDQGGMYKTTDGGKTWKQMIKDAEIAKSGGTGYSQEMFVTLHPDHPDWVYLSSGSHGLWLSQDSGSTWKHFDAIPFVSITRLAWDPKDHEIMYVTTFGGGVWKGPAVP